MRLRKINEAVMGSREYQVPKDNPMAMMGDFYLIDLLKHGPQGSQSNLNSTIAFEVQQAENTLLPYLQQHLLQKAGYSIACELRHVYDQAAYKGGQTVKEWRDGVGFETLDTVAPPENVTQTDEWLRQQIGDEAADVIKDAVFEGDYPDEQAALPHHEKYANCGLTAFGDSIFEWEDMYGGKPWQLACKGWIDLQRARGRELRMYIDRIYQLQHNSGNLLNKNPEYKGEWLTRLLDTKYKANNPEDLMPAASPFMRTLAGYVLKTRYGRAHNPMVKIQKERADDIGAIDKYINTEFAKMHPSTTISKIPNGFMLSNNILMPSQGDQALDLDADDEFSTDIQPPPHHITVELLPNNEIDIKIHADNQLYNQRRVPTTDFDGNKLDQESVQEQLKYNMYVMIHHFQNKYHYNHIDGKWEKGGFKGS